MVPKRGFVRGVFACVRSVANFLGLVVHVLRQQRRELVVELAVGVLKHLLNGRVALALDLKLDGQEPVIVSDDYAVQNMAEHLSLNYGSLANFGIVHKFNWIMYCPACHRRSTGPEKTSRVCGTSRVHSLVNISA